MLGHAPVGTDAEGPLAVRRAQVVRPAGALVALQAAVDGLDDHRGAVRTDPGELVTQNGPTAEPDVAQVRPADARRSHRQQLAGAGRLVQIDHGHPTFHASYGLHVLPVVPKGLSPKGEP